MNRKQLLMTVLTIMIVLAAASGGTAQKAPADGSLMDINSAPPEKLMTLPEINLMIAKKIIAGRPYKNANDLVTKKIVTPEIFKGISSKVTAKQEEKK